MQKALSSSRRMVDAWIPFIVRLGAWAYAVLFCFAFAESIAVLGIIVPGATFVVIFGFLISQGIYNFFDAVLCAAAGAILGDCLSFILGRRGIDPAARFPTLFSQETVERAERFMRDNGIAGVFLGRFIGPLRPFVPFIAGALKMNGRRFMIMNITSGVLWASAYLSIGYFFGQFWSSIHRGIRWVGIGMVVIILGYLFIRYLGDRRRRRQIENNGKTEGDQGGRLA
jgi:membrane protein DedA with SNARE-associated domain